MDVRQSRTKFASPVLALIVIALMNTRGGRVAFGLETGAEQLQPFFADIRVERFEDGLAVTDAEPVLAYIRSSERYHGEDLTGARETVRKAIERHGAFAVAKHQVVISCRKP